MFAVFYTLLMIVCCDDEIPPLPFEHPINNISAQPYNQRQTVQSQLERYPFLRENIKPEVMAGKLNAVSPRFKSLLALSSNLIVDGELYDYCYIFNTEQCVHSWIIKHRLKEFKNENKTVPNCYFLMITRDELDQRIIPSLVEQELGTWKGPEAQNRIDSYKKFLIEAPALMMSVNIDEDYERTKFLIPDGYMLSQRWLNIKKEIEKSSKLYSWENKEEKAYWRGADTGCFRTLSKSLDRFPRLAMVLQGKQRPDLVDAMFTRSHDQCWSGQPAMKEMGLAVSKSVSRGDHVKYKYLPSADGWTAAWDRVPWILQSNSVLLKQESNKVEWFFYKLQPRVHYYPLRNDATDLVEAVEWLKAHDATAREIAEAGTRFANEMFQWDAIRGYLRDVLFQLATIQNYTIPAVIQMIVKNSPKKQSLEHLLTLSEPELKDKLETAISFQLEKGRIQPSFLMNTFTVLGIVFVLILLLYGLNYLRRRHYQAKRPSLLTSVIEHQGVNSNLQMSTKEGESVVRDNE